MTIMQHLGELSRSLEAKGAAREFLQYGIARLLASGGQARVADVYKNRWPLSQHLEAITKAAVVPGSTDDANWAGALAPLQPLSSAFIEFLRPLTVFDQIKVRARPIPFNVVFPRGTSGTAVGWVGQGRPARATRLSTELLSFAHSKIGGIVVTTKELARLSDPASEALLRADMTAACVDFTDTAFLDPALDAVEDVSPASITFGATEVPSTGGSAEHVEANFKTLFSAITTNMVAPSLVMRNTTALALARLRTSGGDRIFPDVGHGGGSIWRVPVLTSNTEGLREDASPEANRIVLIDADEILYAEDGIAFDVSEQATVELNDSPTHPVDANAVMVSMFQHNLVGLRVTRLIRWQRRREGSVAFISGVPF